MSAPDQSLNNIAPDVAARLIDNGEARLLDVREDDEWQAGHSPSAIHLPLGQLDPAEVADDLPVITVCRSGGRSAKAAAALAAAGHRVSNLEGGMRAWSAAGLPVRTDDGSPGSVV
ncbi:rhodanese-like domain-containing protein [Nakamurella sp. A5-74]|uniref:Rhodanese-like domain-containing protein n=1 Tax=Nakamurella sp. A5-74 TaxID=3158264 RepID=A0AAU8DKI0_9ACTN